MKKNTVIFVLLFILSLFVMSCCPCRNLSNTVVNDHKDSSWTKTEIKWKDTIITAPVDSAAIMAMVICPPSGVINTPMFIKKSKQATITAAIVNNQLIAKCKCDSVELLLKQKETIIEGYRLQASSRTELKVISEKYIPRWIKVLAWIGVGLSILLCIKLVLKIKTFFL